MQIVNLSHSEQGRFCENISQLKSVKFFCRNLHFMCIGGTLNPLLAVYAMVLNLLIILIWHFFLVILFSLVILYIINVQVVSKNYGRLILIYTFFVLYFGFKILTVQSVLTQINIVLDILDISIRNVSRFVYRDQ